MTIAKAIARAWTDDAYKAKLLSDPHAALKEVGVTISDEIALKVVEEKDDIRFLVLPKPPPQAGDLSLTDLEQQAGAPPTQEMNCYSSHTSSCSQCNPITSDFCP